MKTFRFEDLNLVLAIAQIFGAKTQAILFLHQTYRRKFTFSTTLPNYKRSAQQFTDVMTYLGYQAMLTTMSSGQQSTAYRVYTDRIPIVTVEMKDV